MTLIQAANATIDWLGSESTRNAIIAGGFAILGVIITTVGVITVAVLNRNSRRADVASGETHIKLDTIHVLVNSRLQVALAGLAMMKRKLGIPILPEELEAERQELSRHKHHH